MSSGVVTMELVLNVISIIGSPNSFGERSSSRHFTPPTPTYVENKRLYRSRSNRILAGVCGGISEYFGIDVVAMRIIAVILTFAAGLTLWIYLILWIVVPLAPIRSSYFNNRNRNFSL